MRLLLLLAAAPLFAQDCSTITAYSLPTNFTAAATQGSVYVGAPDGCAWTYSSDSTWLVIVTGQPKGVGSGSGSIAWSAGMNTLPVQRSGVITIVGTAKTLPVTLTQSAAPATSLSLQPPSASFPVAGGQAFFQVQTDWYWTASSNSPWVQVPANTGGSAAGTVTYTVAASLCAGSRNGSVTVRSAAVSIPSQIFQISQDGSPDNLSISPTSATTGAPAADGRIDVTTGAGCGWNAYSDSAGWLQITSGASGGAAVTYHVTENTGTAPRTGHIVVGPRTFTLTQQGVAPAAVTLAMAMNAASYASGPVSPGEIVTLNGTNLGPAKALGLQLTPDGRSLTTTLGGTTVLFDGAPVPLTYASSAYVNAVVPYGVAGKTTTQVQVQYQGATSNTLTLGVQDATPGIYTLDGSGAGAGAILNQDYSVNGAMSRAARLSWVMIYCTGGGVTAPASVDGALTTSDINMLPRLTQDVSVTIGGIPAPLWYAGGAPELVAGVVQINAQVPAGVTPGANVPVVVKIGNWQSQAGVTLAVK